MDVVSYCDKLENQLTGWKAKIYDVIRTVDQLPANEAKAVTLSVRDLHAIVEEIDNEMEQLRSACPADWSPNRNVIDDKLYELHATLKTLSEKVDGPLIPDTLMWVSE